MPKSIGGWGLKNIYQISQYLAAKIVWWLTHNFSLWGRVMWSKYLNGLSMEDQYRDPQKSSKNGSIVWKYLVASLPLIGPWTVWKIRDGKKVRIKEDP
jgi:hypothetical protein